MPAPLYFNWVYSKLKTYGTEPDELKKLGSGGYASVYKCPWNKAHVLKIRTVSPFQDAWLPYAAFSYKNKGVNPLLPTIHRLRVTRNFYIAEMDKMDYTGRDLVNGDFRSEPSELLFERIAAINDVIRIDSAASLTNGYVADATYAHHARWWRKNVPTFGNTDLHDLNWMVRLSDNRVCITDPFSSNKTTQADTQKLLQKLGVYK